MYCIIGGSGFIGTRLAARLIESESKISIVDKNISERFAKYSVQADVRLEEELLNGVDGEVIVNLAAEHRDDVSPKSLYHDVNVIGAVNICSVARRKGINKIIFTSSVAVYGFAPIGTDESGSINPFNDYGKTKYQAEKVFKAWYEEDPQNRTLVIIRPTVVFGERNRGNVYNLLRQIASGKFIMVGKGKNRKSMAYVENIAAFIQFSLSFSSGLHIYNYIDKPDFDMNTLVSKCHKLLGKGEGVGVRLPYIAGLTVGYTFDCLAWLTKKKFPVSSIRVKKFCSNSVYNTAIDNTDFKRPYTIEEALFNTLKYEFIDDNSSEQVFYTE